MCVGDSNISDVTLIWQLSFSGPPLEMSVDKMEHSWDFMGTWIYSNQKVSVAAEFVEKVHHFRQFHVKPIWFTLD